MSFLIEQAGGASVNGKERIMTLPAEKLHQRVSVVLGSKNEVKLIQKYHQA
jgi:fructose-1,6-bisphosphatase I